MAEYSDCTRLEELAPGFTWVSGRTELCSTGGRVLLRHYSAGPPVLVYAGGALHYFEWVRVGRLKWRLERATSTRGCAVGAAASWYFDGRRSVKCTLYAIACILAGALHHVHVLDCVNGYTYVEWAERLCCGERKPCEVLAEAERLDSAGGFRLNWWNLEFVYFLAEECGSRSRLAERARERVTEKVMGEVV